MIQAFFLCLLLIYYWYFYQSFSKLVAKPSIGSPSKPLAFKFEFNSNQPNHFQFDVNGKTVWEHTLPANTFTVYQGKILHIDPCYKARDGALVPAKGKILYEYLQANPESKNVLDFKENSQFTVQKGNVFYFKCSNGHIDKLEMCPSGTILVANICQAINSCTDKRDGILLPHHLATKFILCSGGNEHVKKCPKDTIFYHNRCEPMDNLNHYCEHYNKPFLLDDETRFECRDGKPFYIRCKPGTKFINHDYCEPANCIGLPDDTKLPLPEQKANPFKYVPGYMTCRDNKIYKTVQCPNSWDETLSKGDKLSLPMVYDPTNQICSIPSFCENVFSDDPDIIVPIHEFTKHIKNWKYSILYDHAAGFTCENKIRKRKILTDDLRISKRFKAEPACGPNMPAHLPMYLYPNHFYNCLVKRVISCPKSKIFNGFRCVPEPINAFKYNNVPLFQFDSLNFESWISPWDYSKDKPVSCQNPESTFIELYNICSHPDCSSFAFLSQIPEMAILLPQDQQAKCKFYENEKILKKEPVDFKYHFWNQKIVDGEIDEKPCKIGQHLETGNFIWDSTIFATCNMNQPFVFCPSTHSRRIIPITDNIYACEPPNENSYILDRVDEWTPFERNEIKRILPVDWNINESQYIQKNRVKPKEILPKDGLDVLENERLNLFPSQKVKLEPRYRVTHPPNVAFEYNDQQIRDSHYTSTFDRGFLPKLKTFTNRALTFPKYTPIPLVESFDKFLYV